MLVLVLERLAAVPQTILSAYALYQSSISIRKLREYETTTEHAAKYSDTVAEQLRKTRTTQGAGAVVILNSLVSSIYILYTVSGQQNPSAWTILLPISNSVATSAARLYIASFWDEKNAVPLPGSGDYNEAISTTDVIMKCLKFLAGTWYFQSTLGVARLLF